MPFFKNGILSSSSAAIASLPQHEYEMASSERRKALYLSFITVGYNVLEGVVAFVAGLIAGSTALVGFGLDSFVESLSGSVMIWRFWKHGLNSDEGEVARAEKKATRLVAYSFFILGAYVTFDAGKALYAHEEPKTSVIGLIIAIASIIIMPVLFYLKYRLGQSIDSPSLVADSKETLACVLLSVALLIGLGVYYVWKVWWIDSAAALVIAMLIFREGYETFRKSS